MAIENMLASHLFIFTLSGIVLVIAGNWVIESSKKLVHLFNISGYAVGFLILALSTSLPELFVSVSAGFQGQGDIVIGNVIGSNVANILLVLGSYAALVGIKVTKQSKLIDFAQALFVISVIPLVLLARGSVGSMAGVILVLLFAVYTLFLTKTKAKAEIEETYLVRQKLSGAFIFMVSVALLLYSSSLLVSSATDIAQSLNVSSWLIGITLIALGTSLPEMVVNVSAIFKKQYKMAIGNILGSCVINLTLVLGVGAAISPIVVDFVSMGSSMIFLVLVNLFVWIMLEKYRKITRLTGLAFLALYLVFILAEIGLVPLFF
jgi:cation:H+ antiporter